MKQPKFNPKWHVDGLVVMIADNSDKHCTEAISKIRVPSQPVMVFRDYADQIGLATLKIEGKRVIADVFLEVVPEGLYPQLQGEPSEVWHPDEPRERVVALDGDEEQIMVCSIPDDDALHFTSLVFTSVPPMDTRIKPLTGAAPMTVGYGV